MIRVPMARYGLTFGDERMPGYILAAQQADRSWVSSGLCWGIDDHRRTHFLVNPTDRVTVGSRKMRGAELIPAALLLCASCPVQFRCTSYAVTVGVTVGTWGCHPTDLAWLAKQTDRDAILEVGEEAGLTVQQTVQRVKVARGPL